jgi:hypothetical protein
MLVATLTLLLSRLTPLCLKAKRLYLDRGFYSVPVIRGLKALNVPFMMPAIIRRKPGGIRADGISVGESLDWAVVDSPECAPSSSPTGLSRAIPVENPVGILILCN